MDQPAYTIWVRTNTHTKKHHGRATFFNVPRQPRRLRSFCVAKSTPSFYIFLPPAEHVYVIRYKTHPERPEHHTHSEFVDGQLHNIFYTSLYMSAYCYSNDEEGGETQKLNTTSKIPEKQWYNYIIMPLCTFVKNPYCRTKDEKTNKSKWSWMLIYTINNWTLYIIKLLWWKNTTAHQLIVTTLIKVLFSLMLLTSNHSYINNGFDKTSRKRWIEHTWIIKTYSMQKNVFILLKFPNILSYILVIF
jgi:hypothetical protein